MAIEKNEKEVREWVDSKLKKLNVRQLFMVLNKIITGNFKQRTKYRIFKFGDKDL